MLHARSHRSILTDAGRGLSSHPLEDNDCSIRATALSTGLTYDEAWDELAGAGRLPLDGFYWEDWARKCGTIQAPWTGKPHWLYRKHQTIGKFPRIHPREVPLHFPKGTWVLCSLEHVETWINGKHHDSETAVRLLNPNRIILGAYECRRIAADQKVFHAWKGYYKDGLAYRSALGPVAATSLKEAYKVASDWYENKVSMKNSDLLVTRS